MKYSCQCTRECVPCNIVCGKIAAVFPWNTEEMQSDGEKRILL